MGKLTRKDFLNNVLNRTKDSTTSYKIENDENFIKYSNKYLPLKVQKTRSTLAPYAGIWSEKQMIHLLKRTMFGVTKASLDAIQNLTMSQAVDTIINAPSTTPSPPINYYENTIADTQNVPFGQTWVNTSYATNGNADYSRYLSTQVWWHNNILNQTVSIEEKMILFWHNHFATQFSQAGEPHIFYNYLQVLKTNARGNFKNFVKEITKNAMMLIFLNGYQNNKFAPDENYARELQELFTLGKGPGMWTEADVQAAAKVLTGFRVDYSISFNYFFDSYFHDETNKTFSSFYNNTVITGQTGANGENELDDLLNMIFTKTDIVAKFICRKIYRYFIHYDITTDIETNIIEGLAQTFISNNWEIKPVLLQLFKSDHFFEVMSMDCLIKNPIDYYLGLIRTTYVDIPPVTDIENAHYTKIMFFYFHSIFAMEPGQPPSVAGWQAYYQSPQFHEMWINSDTLPNRLQRTDYLFTEYGQYITSTLQIRSNVIAFAMTCSNPSDPNVLIDFILARICSFSFSTTTKTYYKSILLTGQTSDYYWTNVWNAYIANPTDMIAEGTVKSRLQQLLTQVCRLAEHQIS